MKEKINKSHQRDGMSQLVNKRYKKESNGNFRTEKCNNQNKQLNRWG